MGTATREWVEKAEGDYRTAQRESVARPPNYDAAAFHAQQCAEKYLKALLAEADVAFTKTHDLVDLLEKTLSVRPEWEAFREDLAYLSDFAVTVRGQHYGRGRSRPNR